MINGSKTDQNAININKVVEETIAPHLAKGSQKNV
jgi:hypothetical protein